MKSPLTKIWGLASLRSEYRNKKQKKDKEKDRRSHPPPSRIDELFQASQDMLDMRSCYDSLLSAAAATANSAFEFSEALEEMGSCLLERNALNEDEDSGRVLLMLGKVQFELQKLVDSYRAHIIQTISTPSDSLLKELQTVGEMKQQCDEKRDRYEFILAEHRKKGRSKHSKGKTFSSQQLQDAQEEYEEEANLFIFRLKSLRQGQSRSLLTQAARYHAAQLNFFKKGLKSLEAVEPHVQVVADREHIDYQFSGLQDDDTEEDYNSYDDESDDGELSFDYGTSNESQDALSQSRNLMELDQVDQSLAQAATQPAKVNVDKSYSELSGFSKRSSVESQSAPIFPNKKFDSSDKIKELRPSSSKRFLTYVLPTPVDRKMPVSTPTSKVGAPTQLWHSSPLDPYKFAKKPKDDEFSISTTSPKAHTTILKERNINHSPIRMPPIPHLNPYTRSDNKKIKQQAFSGPIPRFSATNYVPSVQHPRPVSMTRISPNTSPIISPPSMKSPLISELHELPRPPIGSERPTRPTSLIGHSAPLVYRGPEVNKTSKKPFVAKFLEDHTNNTELTKDIASPPLTPISLMNAPSNTASYRVSS